jgi:hypothetical protein
MEAVMFRPQAVVAVVVSYTLLLMPINGSPAPAIGTITSASNAHIGVTAASVGSTVFAGDHLSTEKLGSIQLRVGAARLLLSESSSVALSEDQGNPSATLLNGTVVFSTANAKAFVLHASKANIRPKTDDPTVAQVTYVSEKELRVRSNRGALAITVEDETQYVVEGMAYRVILDPESYYAAQGAQGAGTSSRKEPHKAGRSRFLLIAIIITGVAAAIALHEAWESEDEP